MTAPGGGSQGRPPPGVIDWNADRRYLAELDGNGMPVPPTLLIAPLGPVPELDGPVMLRPVDRSAKSGHRGGRFDVVERDRLLARLEAFGRDDEIAMIQPWLEEAQTVGIAAVHLVDGEVREVVKGAGLPEADPAEIRLALRVAEWLAARFGQVPSSLRVDTLVTAQGPVLIEVDVLDSGPPGAPIPD